MKNQLITKAISEINNPTLETTKQYLEVHNVELENGEPKIERIDLESFEDVNIVYFPIQDQPFFLTVHFDKKNCELLGVSTENGNQIYFTAKSEILTLGQLAKLTNLNVLSGWSIGDNRKFGNGKYSFSRLSFEPIKSRAYDFDAKLKLLLTDLEKDVDGIKKLAEAATISISVNHQMYISGNKGIHFDIETLHRLSKLNIAIDIDQYVSGTEIKD